MSLHKLPASQIIHHSPLIAHSITTSAQQAMDNLQRLKQNPSNLHRHITIQTLDAMTLPEQEQVMRSFINRIDSQLGVPETVEAVNWPELIRNTALIAGASTILILTLFALFGMFDDVLVAFGWSL
jgi:hypothetical protein